MCQDKVVTYLNAIRYNPVRLPRESFDPLMVLGGEAGDLTYLGSLDDLLVCEDAPPPITRDDQASNVSDRRTDKLAAKAGVDLVGHLLQALGGGAVKAGAQTDQAGGFQIILLNVLHDFVAPLRLGGYLARARLRDEARETLKPYRSIYLVTETLKSSEFGLVAFSGGSSGAQLSADAVRGLIDVSASLQVSTGSGDSVSYKGDKLLRFAFRALPLAWSEDGAGLRLGLAPGALVARGPRAPQPGDYEQFPLDAYPLITAGDLVDIGGA